jgi:prolipoprotein diacylglyceryltransferase
MLLKKIPGAMALYMSAYGVWRFVIEYFRNDDRGSTFVEFLTPSQLVSLVLLVGSVLVYVYTVRISKRNEASDD